MSGAATTGAWLTAVGSVIVTETVWLPRPASFTVSWSPTIDEVRSVLAALDTATVLPVGSFRSTV